MKLLSTSGGCFTKGPILFSHTGEYLFVCHESDIVILDGFTCAFMGRLEPPEGTDVKTIVGLALHPSVSGVLFAAASDNRIYRWNYETGKMLAVTSIPKRRIVALVGPTPGVFQPELEEDFTNTIYAICYPMDKAETTGPMQYIYRIRLDALPGQAGHELLWELPRSISLPAVSADGRRLVFPRDDRITLWNIKKMPVKAELVVFKAQKAPEKLSLHPTESIVYWSAPNGEMHSLDFSLVNSKGFKSHVVSSTNKMHWHAHGVKALTAVPDGKHLLSGGEEGVLVLWSFEPYQRTFLPHLGSEIIAAASSPDCGYYACMLACNSVILVAPGTMKVVGRYDGIKSDPMSGSGKIGGLVKDPRNPSAVLLNSIPGELQSFDPLRGCSYDQDIDVCGQNLVSRGKGEEKLIFSDVYKVAFAARGRWMATYDRRMTESRRLQHDCLRFWKERSGQYQLYTTFDVPHGEEVNQIVFCPVKLDGYQHCVTVGADGKCKIWNNSRRRTVAIREVGKAVQQVCWKEVASMTHKSLRCNSAAYSQDGSILAIAFGTSVRLYDSTSFALLGSLPALGGSRADLKEIIMLDDDWLVGTDGEMLFSWNLSCMTLAWTLAIKCKGLKVHPDGKTFGIICAPFKGMNSILLLKPTSPAPINVYSHARSSGGLVAIDFIGTEADEQNVFVVALDKRNMVQVIGMNQDSCLPQAEPNKYQKRRIEVAARLARLASPEDPLSGVLKIKPLVVNPTKVPVMQRILPAVNREKLLLSLIPGHELPPNTVVFEHFIRSKFPQR